MQIQYGCGYNIYWKCVTIQYRSKHMLLRPYEYDSIVQNPISEADLKWILHGNCEGTEQLRKCKLLEQGTIEP